MNNKDEITLFDKALIGIIPFTLFLALILYLVTGNEQGEVKSIVIGATTSLILNFWNYKTTMKISRNDFKKLRLFSIISFFVRYITIIAIILLAVLLSDFNAIYIVFGFFEYPLFIVIMSIVSGKEASEENAEF